MLFRSDDRSEELIIDDPIVVDVDKGYVRSIANKSGKPLDTSGENCVALRLLQSISTAEKQAVEMEKDGRLPAGKGAEYARYSKSHTSRRCSSAMLHIIQWLWRSSPVYMLLRLL